MALGGCVKPLPDEVDICAWERRNKAPEGSQRPYKEYWVECAEEWRQRKALEEAMGVLTYK